MTRPESFGLPCPTCGEIRTVKESKKGKPYYFCDPCGVQVFVRGKMGVARVELWKSNPDVRLELDSLGIFSSSKLIQISAQLELVREEIKKLESGEIQNGASDVEIRIERLQGQAVRLTKRLDRELLRDPELS